MSDRFDVAIIGSGFAGSILASILSRRGMRVALIDSATHPRFAIGESSTPIADMLLRRLGVEYDLQPLVELSTWGGWQAAYPEIACGRKRGFTYFVHRAGEPFREQSVGENSLWVAASRNDEMSDTHWHRPDVDHFLFKLAIENGAENFSGHTVESVVVEPNQTSTLRLRGSSTVPITSDWVIDASGQSAVLSRLLGGADQTDSLQTETYSSFAHFRGVGSMSRWLDDHGHESQYPFDADDAAQHHLVSDGWMWMLRMNNDVTSVGITARRPTRLQWSEFPTISDLMSGARLVSPPGVVQNVRRLQRMFDPLVGPRQIMLPTAALTLDPLHSTGIAHALAGVDRIVRVIEQATDQASAEYRESFQQETRLLDALVSTAYETMHDFRRFTVASMLYFAGAIRCEERYQNGETPSSLWNSDDAAFVETAEWACGQLRKDWQDSTGAEIRDRLRPWNSAGLLDPAVRNRYAYTAAEKVSSSGRSVRSDGSD